MNFIFGPNCYFNDAIKQKCYQTECDDIRPKKRGWTIYGTSWCSFCKKTINLFNEKGINYFYYDVEKQPFVTREHFRHMFNKELNGYKTLPVIFRDSILIGGYTDFIKLKN